jgi:hypothetical protein
MRSTGRVGIHCGTAMFLDCSPSSLTRWQNCHPVQRVSDSLTSFSSPLPHSLSLHLTLSPLPHSDSRSSSTISLCSSYFLTPPCISISLLSFILILPIPLILILILPHSICLPYNSPLPSLSPSHPPSLTHSICLPYNSPLPSLSPSHPPSQSLPPFSLSFSSLSLSGPDCWEVFECSEGLCGGIGQGRVGDDQYG